MTSSPRLGELLLGIEGLALLRLAFTDAAPARHARLAAIRALLQRWDDTPELTAPLPERASDLTEGYRRWAETYDCPGRLFPIEEPLMHTLLAALPPQRNWVTTNHSLRFNGQGTTIVSLSGTYTVHPDCTYT